MFIFSRSIFLKSRHIMENNYSRLYVDIHAAKIRLFQLDRLTNSICEKRDRTVVLTSPAANAKAFANTGQIRDTGTISRKIRKPPFLMEWIVIQSPWPRVFDADHWQRVAKLE